MASGVATIGLDQAARLLKAGEALVVPTDTVYGLAVMVSAKASPDCLFEIKKRPVEKSIPWLIATLEDFMKYSSSVPEWAFKLAQKHWPGPLTLVCKASAEVPYQFQAEDGSIGLRIPAHTQVLELLGLVGAPLATTSANISGQAPVNRLADLDALVTGQVKGVLVDQDESKGTLDRQPVPSTIVSCVSGRPEVIRQGVLDLTKDFADWGA
ncbi:MAG: L-threonylcarbamoyladenylate synthase [Coriobacteriia bacterium]|nr:L-threonylcarbamoyladenylate synthase [Coriobacteriia bacterium]